MRMLGVVPSPHIRLMTLRARCRLYKCHAGSPLSCPDISSVEVFPIQGVKLYHLTDCLAPLRLCAKGSSGMLLKHCDPGDCDSVTVSLFYAVHALRQVHYGSRWRSFQLHRIIERFPSYLGQYWSDFAHFWTSPTFIPTKSQQSSDFVGLRSYGTDLSIIRRKTIANAHASAVTPVSNSCHKEHCVCTVASSHAQHDAL